MININNEIKVTWLLNNLKKFNKDKARVKSVIKSTDISVIDIEQFIDKMEFNNIDPDLIKFIILENIENSMLIDSPHFLKKYAKIEIEKKLISDVIKVTKEKKDLKTLLLMYSGLLSRDILENLVSEIINNSSTQYLVDLTSSLSGNVVLINIFDKLSTYLYLAYYEGLISEEDYTSVELLIINSFREQSGSALVSLIESVGLKKTINLLLKQNVNGTYIKGTLKKLFKSESDEKNIQWFAIFASKYYDKTQINVSFNFLKDYTESDLPKIDLFFKYLENPNDEKLLLPIVKKLIESNNLLFINNFKLNASGKLRISFFKLINEIDLMEAL